MTSAEVYEWTTQGGATDFGQIVRACESFGPYCLIGGLAVNRYVEPVYTLDADLVLNSASNMGERLRSTSQLRIQFTTDECYQAFLRRAAEAEVLGTRVKVACLEDVTQGKLWAYSDPRRRFTKRKKDELDLIRLAEAYPSLKALYPAELIAWIDRG
jgi:hypothetical protein